MKIEKEDVIIFMSEFCADAYRPRKSFFEKSKEEQLKLIEEYAQEYHLPMSMSKVVDVFVAKRLLSVCDKEKIKQEIKEIKKKRARLRCEKEIEKIESRSI